VAEDEGHELCLRASPDLRHCIADVCLDRGRRDEQFVGDLVRALPHRDVVDDLELATRQLGRPFRPTSAAHQRL